MSKENKRKFERHPIKTAILIDGGFYRKMIIESKYFSNHTLEYGLPKTLEEY